MQFNLANKKNNYVFVKKDAKKIVCVKIMRIFAPLKSGKS